MMDDLVYRFVVWTFEMPAAVGVTVFATAIMATGAVLVGPLAWALTHRGPLATTILGVWALAGLGLLGWIAYAWLFAFGVVQ